MRHKVCMPEKTYLAEHRRLIKLLSSGDKRFKREAKAQEKEVASYLKKRRL